VPETAPLQAFDDLDSVRKCRRRCTPIEAAVEQPVIEDLDI